MAKLIFVLGGARSGKSSFAEELAASCGEEVVYIATAAPLDDEMVRRIELHRQSRPANWLTAEETHSPARVIEGEEPGHAPCAYLLDCVSVLVSNLLLDESFGPSDYLGKEKAILEEVRRFCEAAEASGAKAVIAVSNEVGSGIVPTYSLGRDYRDILGRANQLMSKYADAVYYTVAGLPMDIKEISRQTRRNLLGKLDS